MFLQVEYKEADADDKSGNMSEEEKIPEDRKDTKAVRSLLQSSGSSSSTGINQTFTAVKASEGDEKKEEKKEKDKDEDESENDDPTSSGGKCSNLAIG